MAVMSSDELAARLARGEDPFVLDVRPADDFDAWHVPGSENVPVYETLKDDPESVRDRLVNVLDREPVVTVCAAGVLSQRATDLLRDEGYDARTLEDGLHGWSRVHRHAAVDADVAGRLVQVARPGKGCLSHVLVSGGTAAVFDPSHHVDAYEAVLDEYDADLVGVFDTHAHADHVSGGRRLAAAHDVPYHLHPADARGFEPTPLSDGGTVTIGDVTIDVIHTPGHSPGSVTFALEDAALLTGDTLFHHSVGRVELGVAAGIESADVEGNAERLYESLQRILASEGDPLVLPAHDPGTPEPPVAARLGEVIERNTGLGREKDAFVATLASDVPDHPPNFERVKRVNAGSEDVPDDELSSLELGPNRCAAE